MIWNIVLELNYYKYLTNLLHLHCYNWYLQVIDDSLTNNVTNDVILTIVERFMSNLLNEPRTNIKETSTNIGMKNAKRKKIPRCPI